MIPRTHIKPDMAKSTTPKLQTIGRSDRNIPGSVRTGIMEVGCVGQHLGLPSGLHMHGMAFNTTPGTHSYKYFEVVKLFSRMTLAARGHERYSR